MRKSSGRRKKFYREDAPEILDNSPPRFESLSERISGIHRQPDWKHGCDNFQEKKVKRKTSKRKKKKIVWKLNDLPIKENKRVLQSSTQTGRILWSSTDSDKDMSLSSFMQWLVPKDGYSLMHKKVFPDFQQEIQDSDSDTNFSATTKPHLFRNFKKKRNLNLSASFLLENPSQCGTFVQEMSGTKASKWLKAVLNKSITPTKNLIRRNSHPKGSSQKEKNGYLKGGLAEKLSKMYAREKTANRMLCYNQENMRDLNLGATVTATVCDYQSQCSLYLAVCAISELGGNEKHTKEQTVHQLILFSKTATNPHTIHIGATVKIYPPWHQLSLLESHILLCTYYYQILNQQRNGSSFSLKRIQRE